MTPTLTPSSSTSDSPVEDITYVYWMDKFDFFTELIAVGTLILTGIVIFGWYILVYRRIRTSRVIDSALSTEKVLYRVHDDSAISEKTRLLSSSKVSKSPVFLFPILESGDPIDLFNRLMDEGISIQLHTTKV